MNKIDQKLILKASEFSVKALASEIFIKSGISTDGELKEFLKRVLSVIIPDKKICQNPDHVSPFTLLSALFFGKIEDAVGRANRSGSKSTLAGLITFLNNIFPPIASTRILGGSFDQGERVYEAYSECWEISDLKPRYIKGDIQKEKTKLKNGTQVQILTASTRSVRGPHQPKLILDEIDEMVEEIFTAALSQPQSKNGAKASTLFLSTWHKTHGIMSRVLDNAKKMNLAVFTWCIFEVLASCKDYSCSRCPIFSICPGKQMKNANGYYPIDDLVKKMHHLDEEAFKTEWLCEKPSRKHLVYSKFDENIHVINCDFNSSFPLALSIDWGGVDPYVVLVWQEIPGRGSVIVDEFYQDNIDNPRVIELCKSRKWWPYAQRKFAYCDPSRSDQRREWRTAGVWTQGTKSGLDDISMVRTRLAPMKGDPTLYINRKCKMTIWEFNHYRKDKNDHPIDRNNHSMDCVRYYIRGTYKGEAKRPRVSLGHNKDLLGRPLSKWPFWKGDR